ncbi:hypothetical protein WA158_004047 [Blastocystis sp. Blastoise]
MTKSKVDQFFEFIEHLLQVSYAFIKQVGWGKTQSWHEFLSGFTNMIPVYFSDITIQIKDYTVSTTHQVIMAFFITYLLLHFSKMFSTFFIMNCVYSCTALFHLLFKNISLREAVFGH